MYFAYDAYHKRESQTKMSPVFVVSQLDWITSYSDLKINCRRKIQL